MLFNHEFIRMVLTVFFAKNTFAFRRFMKIVINFSASIINQLSKSKYTSMKKLIITCALLTSVSAISFAQTKGVSNSMSFDAAGSKAAAPAQPTAAQSLSAAGNAAAQKRAKMYEKKLGLTENQYTSAYSAEMEYERQLEVEKANGGPGPGNGYQMGLARDYRYKSFLTADQYKKYETLRPAPQMPK